MLIDGKKIAEVTITAPGGQKVVVMNDDGVQKAPGYEVGVILDRRATPDAIVMKDDVLRYKDNTDTRYLVIETDEKFFSMVPLIVNQEDNSVKLDYDKLRRYPNNRKIGSLDDYNLSLDYREDLEEQEKDAQEELVEPPDRIS